MADQAWELCVLGPLEVRRGGVPVPVGGARQRAVLAALLLSAGELVPVDGLVGQVWNGREPASAVNTLQSYVSRLRTVFAAGPAGEAPRLLGEAGGYRLAVDRTLLDFRRFELLLAEGRTRLGEGEPARARTLLAEALGLWRGPVLPDLQGVPVVQWESARLADLRLTAVELAAEAELACGRPEAAVARLWRPAADHPLREGQQALLMRALSGAGRQAEALELYRQTRTLLVEELGVEPGAGLAAAHRAVLDRDRRPVGRPSHRPWPSAGVADRLEPPAAPVSPLRPGPFVPDGFTVPERLECPQFTLRPITIRDLARDHALVTGARERLWAQFGRSWQWPPPDLSLEQDLVQLAWHQQEFTRRTSFAYAVLTPAEDRMLGCVYLDPATDGLHQVELVFWTGAPRGSALERELAAALEHWLATGWPWSRIARPNW